MISSSPFSFLCGSALSFGGELFHQLNRHGPPRQSADASLTAHRVASCVPHDPCPSLFEQKLPVNREDQPHSFSRQLGRWVHRAGARH